MPPKHPFSRPSIPPADPNHSSNINLFPTNDRLGTLVNELSAAFLRSPSWADFVRQVHGPSHLKANLQDLPHPAGEYLSHLREHGIPVVVCSEPLTPEQEREQLHCGCHKSAQDHAAFLREEMSDNIEHGYWVVLPYDLVKDLPNRRYSPCGVKGEHDRRARLVVDHTWFFVNCDTLGIAPMESMQFGMALPRIAYRTRHRNPRYGAPRMAKFDVTDGFYQMHLRPEDAPTLCTILPRYEGEPQLVAIPLVLTMGWVNSPPIFSALTETICDITNDRMYRHHSPPHRLEPLVEPLDGV